MQLDTRNLFRSQPNFLNYRRAGLQEKSDSAGYKFLELVGTYTDGLGLQHMTGGSTIDFPKQVVIKYKTELPVRRQTNSRKVATDRTLGRERHLGNLQYVASTTALSKNRRVADLDGSAHIS